MKPWTDHRVWVLTFALGAGDGCGDDHAGTTPAETTSTTATGATTTSTTSSTGPDASSGTTGMGTTGIVDLTPWHGMWYALDDQFTVNQPEWWGDGGDGLAFALFELRADGATMLVRNCIWGDKEYEYVAGVDEAGAVVLEPVGVHAFYPQGEIERLYPEPGADCDVLVIRAVWKSWEEGDLFESTVVRRGELCMECAPTQGMQGVISDCGTPVPWQCSG